LENWSGEAGALITEFGGLACLTAEVKKIEAQRQKRK
jgi:hypothetical protein